MQRLHHTLKRELTKTILVWSAAFFALLIIAFSLSIQMIEGYALGLIADQRLSYQTQEFAKHLDQQDVRSIQEEIEALVQDKIISTMLLIDASGNLLHVALSKGQDTTELTLTGPVILDSLQKQVDATPHLHLYAKPIPNHPATLVLILDDQPVTIAIYSATLWSGLMLLMLLLLSIKALHYALHRHLVLPIEQLRQAVNDDSIDDDTIMALELELPDEAADILEIHDHLRHVHTDMRNHITGMIAALPSCFWWSDHGKSYSGSSERSSEILGSTPEQLIGQPLWAWTGSKEQASVNNRLLQQGIAEKRQQLDFAYQVVRDDKIRWFGESITLCYHKDGQLKVIYGIINDISKRKDSQRKQAEAIEVEHRLQATSTLVGGIAHEFNNALAGMNGNLFLIKQTTNDAQTHMRINRIEQLIDRSASIIDRMLAFSRQSIGHPIPIDLKKFLDNFTITLLPGLSDNVNFTLHLDAVRESAPGISPCIQADEKKIHDVLMQLIDNALLATKESSAPHIELSLAYFEADDAFLRQHSSLSSRSLLHLSISDNGGGIPEDIQKRIFEPFFTTRDVGQGTGLGLSMVHGYIHQIGGDISFESGTGHGTTFHIYLPRILPLPDEAPLEITLHGDGELILVIDDDKMVCESTCTILDRMGYQSIAANSGEQGVALFSQHQAEIRLVFMDILMPGINGIEASRRIRKLDPDMPVIFITGYDRTQPLEPEVYAENTELINKPFRINMLSLCIQQALDGTLGKAHA